MFSKKDLIPAPIDGKCIQLSDYIESIESNFEMKETIPKDRKFFSFKDKLWVVENGEIDCVYGEATYNDWYEVERYIKYNSLEDIDVDLNDYSIWKPIYISGCIFIPITNEHYMNKSNKGRFIIAYMFKNADLFFAVKKLKDFLTECNNDDYRDPNWLYCKCETDVYKNEVRFAYYYHKSRLE